MLVYSRKCADDAAKVRHVRSVCCVTMPLTSRIRALDAEYILAALEWIVGYGIQII